MFYYIYVACVVLLMFNFLRDYRRDCVAKRLEGMIQAQQEGRSVMGKLTCLTKEGKVGEAFYRAEYMYVVDGKRYFVTYKLNPRLASTNSKTDYDGDALASEVKKYLTLFYEKGNPANVRCKAQVFASQEAIQRVYSNSKDNIYRDVEKDWTEAIDLTRY